MNMGYIHWIGMRLSGISPVLLAIFLAACVPAAAQLSSPEPDPLARIRDAARTNVQACSATGETLCEQVAPKIVANAQGDSPLAGNVRLLAQGEKDRKNETPGESAAVALAVAAFGDAGLQVHTEKYFAPATGVEGETRERENTVAEIRGREKPEEWVLLGADLGSSVPGSGSVEEACNAALVIEAARDIQLTGIRPRRSIRFVLFGGRVPAQLARLDAGREGPPEPEVDQRASGSWAYLRAHRDELDRMSAAILFDAGVSRMNGFTLNGRRDIESGVREAIKPIGSMGATNLTFDAPLKTDSLDFLLEGIPTVVAAAVDTSDAGGQGAVSHTLDKIDSQVDLKDLKRNTAIVAVAAFGVAESAAPIGPRLSRAEIESLLKTTGLERQMKTTGLWPLWESGERGRVP